MRQIRFRLIAILIFTLGSAKGFTAERREFYNGIRGLGMGGAVVATVNDETALILNPAALGKLREKYITVVDPEIAISSETQAIIGYDIMAALDPERTLALLNDGHHGKHLHESVKVFPSMVFPNFGFGFLGSYIIDAEVDKTGSTYNYDYTNDFAFIIGYNFRLWDGRIKLGFNARVVNRVQASEEIALPATGLSLSSMAKEGTGVGSDVGLLLAAPWAWIPTLGVVYRDAGNTHYDIQNGLLMNTTERPEVSESSLDAAVALSPILGKKTRMSITAEYRNLLRQNEEEDKAKLMHFGMELNYADAIFVRAGYNQRYWTAGLEFAMFNYQFQMATYGEEIGTADNPREDRRYVGKFAYRF